MLDNRLCSISCSIKFGIVNEHRNFHVAEVIHLLLMIIYARFMDLVANITELFVYIVAGDEDEFPSLVIVVVRDSPQAEFSIVQIVVIEAEEASVLSFSEIIQRCS